MHKSSIKYNANYTASNAQTLSLSFRKNLRKLSRVHAREAIVLKKCQFHALFSSPHLVFRLNDKCLNLRYLAKNMQIRENSSSCRGQGLATWLNWIDRVTESWISLICSMYFNQETYRINSNQYNQEIEKLRFSSPSFPSDGLSYVRSPMFNCSKQQMGCLCSIEI